MSTSDLCKLRDSLSIAFQAALKIPEREPPHREALGTLTGALENALAVAERLVAHEVTVIEKRRQPDVWSYDNFPDHVVVPAMFLEGLNVGVKLIVLQPEGAL